MKNLIFVLIFVLISSTAASAKEIAGINMPDNLKLDNKTLVLNGTGVIKKFLFKVYAIGLYLEKKSSDENELLNQDKPYIIRLHFVRDDIPAENIIEAWNAGFEKSTDKKITPIKKEIEQFNSYFTETIRENNVFQFEYIPGTGTRVLINNQLKGTIPGWQFKKALLSIWIGKNPRDSGVKDDLLDK